MEKKKKIKLNRELIRQLRDAEVAGAVGGLGSPCDGGTGSVPNPSPCNPVIFHQTLVCKIGP